MKRNVDHKNSGKNGACAPAPASYCALSLDVVIPTYNRRTLLEKTLLSLKSAIKPPGLEVQIIVVDNNSTDDTRDFMADCERTLGISARYVFERRQGRSSALNAGIAAGNGELVGMIDDDEEVGESWYQSAASAFRETGVDFIGGPYLPNWEIPPPEWLPSSYLGVIGWIDGGPEVAEYGDSFPGILMGGNAVLKRSLLEKVGPYNASLSRTGTRLLAGEDEDMYSRLLKAGARGLYLPDLIIYHHIPAARLTKSYFRRWCFWRGVSRGLLDRESRSQAAYLAGVPQWLYGQAVRGMVNKTKAAILAKSNAPAAFSGELAVWDLAGFFYGRHFYKAIA